MYAIRSYYDAGLDVVAVVTADSEQFDAAAEFTGKLDVNRLDAGDRNNFV